VKEHKESKVRKGGATLIDLDSTAARKPDLHNFFVCCDVCEYDLRFDFYDQIRICPRCGTEASLSPAYQNFLRKEKVDNQRRHEALLKRFGIVED
jgi:predicted amidophosphoribosyltransferase